VHGYASGNRQEGYRAHSEGYRLRAGLNAARPLGPNTRLRLTAAGDVQDTENPSSITLQNFREDPTQAYQEFVDVNAGKESEQGQVGAFVTHDLDPVTLSGSGYYLYRSLENPLNYATITYDRHSGGGRFTLHRTEGRLEGGIGIDSGLQSDDRVEFDSTSASGEAAGEIAISQQETILSGAAFGYLRVNLTEQLALTGGFRFDRLRFEADDRLTADGDQSGTRTFSSWSPSFGAAYEAGNARLYAQYSTAFETPTASELSNRPSGEGGFNQQVEPQRTRGFEIGARGVLPDAQLQYDVALYRLDVDDLISSYEGPTGRDVYANLAANTHDGIEASFTWQATPNLEMAVRYTGTRFVVTEIDTTRSSRDANLIGNRVPGVPSKRLYLHTEIEHNSLWARLSGEGVSSIYTNNANTAEAPRYVLVDLRVGHRGLDVGGAILKPFAAVDNVLNEDYASSVVVNAFGGRYYEPGPERAFSLGLNVAW
jgi:iron complex outermembrane receptor protein